MLKLLSLKDTIITIDGMGTQKATAIAKQIHDEGGFYVLALKGNQGALNNDVRLFLESDFMYLIRRVQSIICFERVLLL